MNDSYSRRGYAERGYAERGYADRGYAERGYAEDGYADRGYAERGYADRGYGDRGYGEDGYAERGYGRRGYGRGGQNSTRTGAVIITALSLLSAFLVIWGLYYATGIGERHKVALAAAGCEPNLLSVNVQCTTVFVLNNQYKRVANPAVQQVNTDMADYASNERTSLTAAVAALEAAVTSENGFDKSLAKFPFPPSVAPIAKVLMRDIAAQAKLTAEQARSSSLVQIRSFNGRVSAASATVRTELALVHKTLEKRPTPSMEP
jgi:hypothetical protein